MAWLLIFSSAYAGDNNLDPPGPWEKVSFKFGGFLARTDTSFRLGSADGEDIPGVDFKGNVEFSYTGINLYGRLLF